MNIDQKIMPTPRMICDAAMAPPLDCGSAWRTDDCHRKAERHRRTHDSASLELIGRLSPRERDIFMLMIEGYNTGQIAQSLGHRLIMPQPDPD